MTLKWCTAAGYTGLAKRPEIQADSHLSGSITERTRATDFIGRFEPPALIGTAIEHQKSHIRSKAEYVFLILKRLFGYRKVRCRGLEKNRIPAFILGAAPICSCWRNPDGTWAMVVSERADIPARATTGPARRGSQSFCLAFPFRPLIEDCLGECSWIN